MLHSSSENMFVKFGAYEIHDEGMVSARGPTRYTAVPCHKRDLELAYVNKRHCRADLNFMTPTTTFRHIVLSAILMSLLGIGIKRYSALLFTKPFAKVAFMQVTYNKS
jgi:hypothetical protein